MNEGKEVAPQETRRQKLERFLSGAKVGTPKFMAFWDQVDLVDTRPEPEDPKDKEYNTLKRALVENRIDMRMSEVPGYAEHSFDAGNLTSDARADFNGESADREFSDYLSDLRTSILPNTPEFR